MNQFLLGVHAGSYKLLVQEMLVCSVWLGYMYANDTKPLAQSLVHQNLTSHSLLFPF